jgi:8-oxo-dGTP pyrophosphatase MutT (NUDIX family)
VNSNDREWKPAYFSKEERGSETASWTRKESNVLSDCRVFKVRRDRSSRNVENALYEFYCIEAPDWVNIIPLTSDGDVVMIEQFRHGSEEITLEIPGGIVDPGESPPVAASREMVEETGFVGANINYLGQSRPNPAIQNNWIHSFVAHDVEMKEEPQHHATEHTSVRLVRLIDVPGLIADGTITHSLVIAAFYKLGLFESGLLIK